MGRQWFLKAQYATGGGGGSGHIIVDDGGYALTQRSKMQFNGTYSEDNSTDGVTEVNITRTMTRSEFELLSNDEKKGLINVIDETSGVDGKFQPVIYSEEEREIGVWIDGKPLYQKTLKIAPVALSNGSTIAHNISNLDIIVDSFMVMHRSNGEFVLPYTSAYNRTSNFIITSTDLAFVSSDTWGASDYINLYVTLRYTKSTDTAGSGTWTPQGVPAHHYSTDEQVVGTWTDGSTLYQKTYSYSISSETSQEIATLDSNIVVKEIKGIIHNNGNDMTIPWIDASFFYNIYSASTHKLTAIKKNTGDWTGQAVEVTIRYTKSST